MPLSFRLIIPWPWYPSSKVMMIGRFFERSRTIAFVSLLIFFVSLVILHCYPFCLCYSCHACLAMPRHAAPVLSVPGPANPRLPCPAVPCLAHPRHACLAVSCHTWPRLAIPCLPCRSMSLRTEGCLAMPALPGRAKRCHATANHAYPRHACPAAPYPARPSLALPYQSGHAVSCPTHPRLAAPRLTCPATPRYSHAKPVMVPLYGRLELVYGLPHTS